jgi:hypothetical protein
MTSAGRDSAHAESQAVALWRETPLGLRLAYFRATALPQ